MPNGMKSGSGDDPFADMDDDEGGEDEDSVDEEAVDADPLTNVETEMTPSTETSSTPDVSSDDSGGLPWIYQRSSIHEDRKTRQIHLQQETERREGQAKSDLERRLDETVKKADLREAALRVGLENIDEVADELREWGYDYD